MLHQAAGKKLISTEMNKDRIGAYMNEKITNTPKGQGSTVNLNKAIKGGIKYTTITDRDLKLRP